MKHIRAVVNQCGVAMELHGHTENPVMIALVPYAELGAYRAELARYNPDHRYAIIGHLAVMYANHIFQNIDVSQTPWTYNASTNEYHQA